MLSERAEALDPPSMSRRGIAAGQAPVNSRSCARKCTPPESAVRSASLSIGRESVRRLAVKTRLAERETPGRGRARGRTLSKIR